MVAHVVDHARPDGYVEVSAGVLLLYGVGSVVGPIAASTVMEISNPQALFGYMSGVNVLEALYVVHRMFRRGAVPAGAKEDFQLANAAPVLTVAEAEAFEESSLVVDP